MILTLDQTIQYHAEAAFTTAITQSNAKSGTAIVLDPRTGEILALANAPTFDPNNVGAVSPATRATGRCSISTSQVRLSRSWPSQPRSKKDW